MAFVARDQLNEQKGEPIQTQFSMKSQVRTIRCPSGHLLELASLEMVLTVDVCRYAEFKKLAANRFLLFSHPHSRERLLLAQGDIFAFSNALHPLSKIPYKSA